MDKYLEAAIEEYEQNIESGQSFYMDASILMDIEEYYEKNERLYDAERVMRFAEKLHPDNEDVLIVKAYRLKAIGKWDEAYKLIQQVPNQENRDVQLFLIEWDIAMVRMDKAEKRLEANIHLYSSSEDDDWYYDMCDILIDYGYHECALKYLKKISSHYPLRTKVDEFLGIVYYQLNNFTESIAAFSRVVDAEPYNSLSWTQLAEVQYKVHQYEECEESCDYALAIDGSNIRAMHFKLCSLFALEKTEEAMHLYEEYAKENPNDYTIRMMVGEQLSRIGNFAAARKPLQEALRLCPLENQDRVRIVSSLVDVFIAYDKLDEARELMFTLTLSGSSLFDIHLQLAEEFFLFQKEQAGLELLAQATQLTFVEDKDFSAIIQLLFKEELFVSASSIWKRIALRTFDGEYKNLYAYIAYAFLFIKKRIPFINNFQRAEKFCPDILCSVFSPSYQARTLEELKEYLTNEINKWEDCPIPSFLKKRKDS